MFKKDDIIVYIGVNPLDYGTTFKVKYILSNCVVVNDLIHKYDFPIPFKDCVLYSSLIKELL